MHGLMSWAGANLLVTLKGKANQLLYPGPAEVAGSVLCSTARGQFFWEDLVLLRHEVCISPGKRLH